MEQDLRARGGVGQEMVVSVLSLTYCSLLYGVCGVVLLKEKNQARVVRNEPGEAAGSG